MKDSTAEDVYFMQSISLVDDWRYSNFRNYNIEYYNITKMEFMEFSLSKPSLARAVDKLEKI